ncbi:MAG: hypothetical protein IKF90_07705 [Parasporobacterium sp.]|nr:hypothetical protein [Parasporobacterium sp.]
MNKEKLIELGAKMDMVMQDITDILDKLEELMGEDEILNECYECLEDSTAGLADASEILDDYVKSM